jgi:hypothetical protein
MSDDHELALEVLAYLNERKNAPPAADDHYLPQFYLEFKYDVTKNPLFLIELYQYARKNSLPPPLRALEYFDRVAARLLAKEIDGTPQDYLADAMEMRWANRWAFARHDWFEKKFLPAVALVRDGSSATDAALEVGIDPTDFKQNLQEFESMQLLSTSKKR